MRSDLPPDLRLCLRHVRAVDPQGGPLCSAGIRAWCRQHGIDLHTLATTGIVCAERPDLHDDPFVVQVITIALAERRAQRDADARGASDAR